MDIPQLQQILGADKRNPQFTIFKDKNEVLIVFYGAELLMTVPGDKNDIRYKMLAGYLYNAKVKRKILVEAFGVARTTLQRWGVAVKEKDNKKMLKALGNPGFPNKITEEIKRYIKARFSEVYKDNHYSYSQEMLKEVKNVFETNLSSSGIRSMLKELKNKYNKGEGTEKRACIVDSGIKKETKEIELNNKDIDGKENTDKGEKVSGRKVANRQSMLSFYHSSTGYELCNHAGVLIFSTILNRLKYFNNEINNKIILIKQWIISILLGAMNIEQTKLLDFNSVEVILGEVMKSLNTQRDQLTKLSEEEQLKAMLLKYNCELVKIERFNDFYFDPHIKHYTGAKKILKGWCSSIRIADKIINMDFLHTVEGHPVYIEESDNFEDLRVRFKEIIKRFRQKVGIGEEKTITYIVDRGIYKIDLFRGFIKEKIIDHFVIWEKDYKKGSWEEEKETGSFVTFRARNDADDLLKYEFKYIDQAWSKEEKIRQIIVMATNPKGNTIEVSILSSDKERKAEEIIKMMFSRWIQENDFKYLNNHFGINEITSYKSILYTAELGKSLQDRPMKSGEYKAFQMNLRDTKKELSKLLLQEHLSGKKKTKRDDKIAELTKKVTKIKKMLGETQKEVSRLNTIIAQRYYKMNPDAKILMDIIKIISRNMFYEAFKPFKEKYNNYRDDHVIFRNLTRALGGISFGKNAVEIVLFPTMNYTPKTREVVEEVLENINSSVPVMPDGSNRRIKFSLGQKVSKLYTILPWDKEKSQDITKNESI